MKPLTVYGNAFHVRSAGQYYRIRAPFHAMQQLGLARTFADDPFQDGNLRNEFITQSDVQVHFLTAGKQMHLQTKKFTELRPALNANMDMQYPPVVIFDMDDDIESISPLNPKYCTLGTRGSEGEILMPNDEVGIKFEKDNRVVEPLPSPGGMGMDSQGGDEPVYLWKKGMVTVNGTFDIARNVIQHAQVRKMAATAHAITVTTPQLAKVAARWNKRVHVYPNSINFSDFHKFDIRRNTSDVRVLWQGGYSHFPDFYPLRGAIGEASKRLPQMRYVVFGTMFNWIYERIAPGRVEFHPWVDFMQFHLKLGTLAFDVNIAPLANTAFNQAKSAIKFYEAAALKVPTLAQRTGPYADEIIDGDTGYLFDQPTDFVEKLEALVKDADLRAKMGQRAHDWVREHRDAAKTVRPLVEFYRSLRKEVWSLPDAA